MKDFIAKIRESPHTATIMWLVGLIVAWEIGACVVAVTKRSPENVLPHLYQIIAAIFSTTKVSGGQTVTMIVLSNAAQTLLRAGIGFIIGAGIGFILAIFMRLSNVVEKIAFPYLMLIQMIPILGMAPIVLAVTHDIGTSRIVIAAILTFYPVCSSTLAGLKSVEQEKLDLMHLCAANKGQSYFYTLIPTAIPYLFTGLKIAAPMAITASILVDTLQGDGGLGCMLSQSLKHALSIYVFWLIVFLSALVGVLSSWLMSWLEKRIAPQHRCERVAAAEARRQKRYMRMTTEKRTAVAEKGGTS